MFEKQVTRKQFLVSIASVLGVVVLSKIPKIVTKNVMKEISPRTHAYGNHAYGGSKRT